MIPLISIITPVFNTKAYLHKCFDSIINQNFQDFEVIIVDDGSSDGSLDICKIYASKDNRIKLFTQPNKGVSVARNVALENAIGEWIYFVDSDDWLDLDALENLVICIKENRHSDLIRCFSRKIDEHGRSMEPNLDFKKFVLTPNELLESNLTGGYIHSLFVKRDIINNNNIRFLENVKFKEDLEFTFRCVMNSYQIVLFNKCFYNYNIRRQYSLTRNFSFERSISHLIVGEHLYKYSINFFNNKSVSNFVYNKLLEGLISFIIEICFKNSNVVEDINSKFVRIALIKYIYYNNIYFLPFKSLLLVTICLVDYRILRSLKIVKLSLIKS